MPSCTAKCLLLSILLQVYCAYASPSVANYVEGNDNKPAGISQTTSGLWRTIIERYTNNLARDVVNVTSVAQSPAQGLGVGPDGLVLSIHWLSNAVFIPTYYAIMIGIAQGASEEPHDGQISGRIEFDESLHQVSIAPRLPPSGRRVEYQHMIYGIYIVSERMYQRRIYQEFISDILVEGERVGTISFRRLSPPAGSLGTNETNTTASEIGNSLLDGNSQNNTAENSLMDGSDHLYFLLSPVGSKTKLNAETLFLLTLRIISLLAENPADSAVTEPIEFGRDTKVLISLSVEPPNPRTNRQVRHKDVTYTLAKVVTNCVVEGFWPQNVTWWDVSQPTERILLGTMMITINHDGGSTTLQEGSTVTVV